jgi:hypothetical protein
MNKAGKPPKPKKCDTRKGGCGQTFTPSRPMQCACGIPCSIAMAGKARDKKAAKAATDDRKATKAKLEKFKTRSQWIKEAQHEFNRYIRFRDSGQPCICCGMPLGDQRYGGSYDAGHYRSIGSAPHLRFDERNVHAQRKQCNLWGAGRAIDYRMGLIARLGQGVVDSIESDQSERKYTIDELKAIKSEYSAKAKAIQKKPPSHHE